ncbi:trypsin-like peptidase domain-containing protein [Roseomonas sp. HJA6]|uniref:Trypsin-like peptidase domain-containing protein n=1 Tax=Roseomonas alba TaxID=2846776 RepID=A0ABS7A5X2_9PROT|nr:serine protease [Neoroseomonas alba]MBW6396574.1 trypsin-like peptidase domain-containing protein [Neoroseomonas alba]
MRSILPLVAFAAACAALPALAQKPGQGWGGGSLGNLPPPPTQQGPQFTPQPQRPQARPQMALPRDKPPPLGGQQAFPRPPQPGAGPRPPSQMAALPRDKPPPLGGGRAPGPQAGLGPSPGPQAGGRQPPRPVSSGTGFVVAPRQVMTNHHVAAGCTAMTARTQGGQDIAATVIAVDEERDLALLRTDADAGPVLSFRRSTAVRRGENVVTYGFPLAGLLSSGPTLTTGDVSALAGLGDNPRQIQISAPVQQGNSGGPLLDLHGQIVGVIVSKLNAQRIAQATGDIPQNVNFAVKHTEAIDFLREHGVQPQMEEPTGALRTAAEIGEVAHASTLFLRCLR